MKKAISNYLRYCTEAETTPDADLLAPVYAILPELDPTNAE